MAGSFLYFFLQDNFVRVYIITATLTLKLNRLLGILNVAKNDLYFVVWLEYVEIN